MMMNNKRKSKLTVVIPCYNKEKYLASAIKSVLSQKCDFDVHIIVTDDGSTDSSIDIVTTFQKQHASKITLRSDGIHRGLLGNVIEAYKLLDCEYFAFLDADDYLIDPNFYQKAIAFLDKHEGYTIYAANTYQENSFGNRRSWREFSEYQKDSNLGDFFAGTAQLGNTISSVFRNVAFHDGYIFPPMLSDALDCYSDSAYREDEFRNLFHLQYGDVHFVNDFVGVYRITSSGIFQGSNRLRQICYKCNFYLEWSGLIESHQNDFQKLAYQYLDQFLGLFLANPQCIFDYPLEDAQQMAKILWRLSQQNRKALLFHICFQVFSVSVLFRFFKVTVRKQMSKIFGPSFLLPPQRTEDLWRVRVTRDHENAVLQSSPIETDNQTVTAFQQKIVCDFISPYLTGQEKTALDFGCGAGRHTCMLEKFVSGKVFGVDFSKELLEKAPQQTARVCFLQNTSKKIPLENHSIDLIFIAIVLGGLKDNLPFIISELKRISSPNALFFIMENTSDTPNSALWTYRSSMAYIELFDFVDLKKIYSYDDYNQEISVLVGRKKA